MRKIQIYKDDIIETDIPTLTDATSNPYITCDHILAVKSETESGQNARYYADNSVMTIVYLSGHYIKLKHRSAKMFYEKAQLGLVESTQLVK